MDMDQVSLTGDAIAAVVLGCVGTGQGLGDELGEVDERSLNWRAEPASPRKAGVYSGSERLVGAVGLRAAVDGSEPLMAFAKNANRQGTGLRSGGPVVGSRREKAERRPRYACRQP